jgi:hypothetical protein
MPASYRSGDFVAAQPRHVDVREVRAFVSAWKKSFDAGKSNREKAGLNERYVMRDVEKPNFVIVVRSSTGLAPPIRLASSAGLVS